MNKDKLLTFLACLLIFLGVSRSIIARVPAMADLYPLVYQLQIPLLSAFETKYFFVNHTNTYIFEDGSKNTLVPDNKNFPVYFSYGSIPRTTFLIHSTGQTFYYKQDYDKIKLFEKIIHYYSCQSKMKLPGLKAIHFQSVTTEGDEIVNHSFPINCKDQKEDS